MPTPAYLLRLMAHHPISARMRLGPEDQEAYAFANDLRVAALEGRLRAVWTHPANELAGMVIQKPGGGVKVPPLIALARALGLITGTSDYLFLWAAGACAIEFKSRTGTMTDGQRDFQSWCQDMGVPFYVVRSCAAGLEILRQLGVLR